MKLINKLLPLMSMGAITTIVAPLTASCNNTSSLSVFQINVGDVIENGYKRKTKCLPVQQLTEEQGMAKYFDEIKQNPQLFYDDFVIDTLEDYLLNPTPRPIVKTTTGNLSIKFIDADAKNKRFSYEYTQNYVEIDTSGNYRKEIITNITYTFNNLLLDFYYDGASSGRQWWCAFPSYHYDFYDSGSNADPFVTLSSDDQWSISMKGTRITKRSIYSQTEIFDEEYDSHCDKTTLYFVYEYILSDCASMYIDSFKNVLPDLGE